MFNTNPQFATLLLISVCAAKWDVTGDALADLVERHLDEWMNSDLTLEAFTAVVSERIVL